MSREFKHFISKILIASLILVAAGWSVFTFITPGKYLSILPWMLIFFALVTILTYGYQLRLSKKNMGRFTRSSMLVSFLRLVLYSLFAIIYLATDSENAAVFVVCLVVIYLVFNFLEVADLFRISRKNK
jgi:hypothetical protein